MYYGEHGVVGFVGEGGERERDNRLHSTFALHAPIHWAVYGHVTAEEGVTAPAG